MQLLLSNDDGVSAPGIQTLFSVFSKCEQVKQLMMMAPDTNRSGASNSLTINSPLRVKKYAQNQYAVDGTPTDCVHLALTGYFDELPAMVISGINKFANLGDDTLYSGTVAAAVEGRFFDMPSIAVSLCGDTHYESAARVTMDIFHNCLKKPLKKGTILNVNVPDIPYEKIKGYEITRLGTRHVANRSVVQQDPRGDTIYWIGASGLENDNQVGTDFHAIKNNRVSITPLTSDMSDYSGLQTMVNWL